MVVAFCMPCADFVLDDGSLEGEVVYFDPCLAPYLSVPMVVAIRLLVDQIPFRVVEHDLGVGQEEAAVGWPADKVLVAEVVGGPWSLDSGVEVDQVCIVDVDSPSCGYLTPLPMNEGS